MQPFCLLTKRCVRFQGFLLCIWNTVQDCFLKNAITLLPCVESMLVSMVTENMVRGLEEDETNFLEEVSQQQCLMEKRRRDEERQELLEYRISFCCIGCIENAFTLVSVSLIICLNILMCQPHFY